MQSESHVLMDAGEELVADGVVCEGRAATAGGRNWKVNVHTFHRGGRSEGVRVVAVDNGAMTISILPTRGMGIWQVLRHHSPASSRAGDRGAARLGWRSPVHGPVHPAFVPLFDPSGLGWLEGFDELLCRCGLESNGAPDFDSSGKLLYPLHGRIANLPAHRVEVFVDEARGRLSLRGVVDVKQALGPASDRRLREMPDHRLEVTEPGGQRGPVDRQVRGLRQFADARDGGLPPGDLLESPTAPGGDGEQQFVVFSAGQGLFEGRAGGHWNL